MSDTYYNEKRVTQLHRRTYDQMFDHMFGVIISDHIKYLILIPMILAKI